MANALQQDIPSDLRPHRLPEWVARQSGEAIEDAGFSAGAAVALLDFAQENPDVPQTLWRRRLALKAAAHAVALSSRAERDAELRDILCLLRPGEHPGPAGDIALVWQRAAICTTTDASLMRAMSGMDAHQIALWRAVRQGNPVAQAAQIIDAILTDTPREIVTALILADASLARAMGWPHLIPLLGVGLRRGDLTLRGDDLRLACHKGLVRSVKDALALSADLTRRAVRLRSVAPKLRSKQAAQAVELLLTRDAIAPAALTALMSDRAARRFCDRLVTLGALREMTGRDSFRLYGL